MAHLASNVAIGLILTVFGLFGIAASVYSARHLVVAFRTGTIRQSGRTLSFQVAPARFVGAVVHISLGLLAGVLCAGLVALLLTRAV